MHYFMSEPSYLHLLAFYASSLYQWAFYYAPLWFVIVFVSLLMYWVYAHVRNQEKRMEKYASNSLVEDSRKQMTQHKRVKNQASMYVGAFLITWFFPTLFQLVIVIAGKFPFPLLLLTATFVPIQGFLNLVVFLRPKFMRYKNANPGVNTVKAWFEMLYLEVTGQRTPSRTSAITSASGIDPKTPHASVSSSKHLNNQSQKTCRLSGCKPSIVSGTSDAVVEVEEEKEEEDAAIEDEEFGDDSKQAFTEVVSP